MSTVAANWDGLMPLALLQPWYVAPLFAAVLLLGAVSLWMVRRDYRRGDALRRDAAVAVWLLYILHALSTFWLSWRGPWRVAVPAALAWIVGALLILAGVALCWAAFREFRTLRRVSGRQVDQLIASGIYRYSRNPQNLGWGLVLTGAAIAGRSPAAMSFALLFWVVFHVYTVRLEEPYLETIYGRDYQQYRRRTARYLGRPAQPDNRNDNEHSAA